MGGWLGVVLAFSPAELARPITDHQLAFSMAEWARTDGRVFFRKEQRSKPLLPLVFCFECVCLSVTTGRREKWREKEKWRWTQRKVTGKRWDDHRMRCVRLSESWNPGPESRLSRSWNTGPETQVPIGLAWLLKIGFLGRYQYIKNLLKKRRRGYKASNF